MLKRWILVVIVVALSACLSGCGKKETPPAEANDVEVKSMAEYEAEAKKDINEQNMDAELKKLQESIEADTPQ
ncbi:MAG TPA: hypothetical protein ENN81_10000 [Phycisphaerales bacterium]|nr:hypothetical protein [Phycisphaerales bacterium]